MCGACRPPLMCMRRYAWSGVNTACKGRYALVRTALLPCPEICSVIVLFCSTRDAAVWSAPRPVTSPVAGGGATCSHRVHISDPEPRPQSFRFAPQGQLPGELRLRLGGDRI
jgi:hypothetical protein